MLGAHSIEKKTTHHFFIYLLVLRLKIQQMIQSN
nr:MAG TPA: hypothetical protein [Caudoviricetes sp.]